MNFLKEITQIQEEGNKSSNSITMRGKLSKDEIEKIRTAPKPYSGEVVWAPPEDYAKWLQEAGCFTLEWYSQLCDISSTVTLMNASDIRGASRSLYLPQDVSAGGDGRLLTTNHLVPFCSAGYTSPLAPEDSEAWFCFDASQGQDYPVYYSHVDDARCKYIDSGDWYTGHYDFDGVPDFKNFRAWIHWLVDALARGSDSESLGSPSFSPSSF